MEYSNILLLSFTDLIRLIEVVIWPITLLLALLFFRKNLAGIISSLGSVKAGASGFEMTFQEKLNSVADIIESDNGARSKSASDISVNAGNIRSPYQQLLSLRDKLSARIVNKATQNNLDVNTNSITSNIDALKNSGVITIQTARQLYAFIDLTASATRSVSQEGVNKAEELYNKLDF